MTIPQEIRRLIGWHPRDIVRFEVEGDVVKITRASSKLLQGYGAVTPRNKPEEDACVAVGWAGHRTLTVDRPEQAGGMGLGFNGAELLLLAIGGCYSNDLFREAAKLGMVIKSVQVDVQADWGGDPFVRKMSPTLPGSKQRPAKPIFWP